MSLDNQTVHSDGTVTEKWDPSVMTVNTEHNVILENVKTNTKRHLPQLQSYGEQETHVCIVGGGWSLDDTYEELRDLYFRGAKIVALNGAAKWLMERNLRPSLHIVLDAREANTKFVETPIYGCKYLLASQCHPKMFEMCEGRDVTIFHAITEESKEEIEFLNTYYSKRWTRIPPAGTVGATAPMLLRILGFRFQHLFGIDSCYRSDGKHHAYPQSLNDEEGSAPFRIADREFRCSAWQASQARNFLDMLKVNGGLFEIEIHGDGLLAHLIKTGAEMPPKES